MVLKLFILFFFSYPGNRTLFFVLFSATCNRAVHMAERYWFTGRVYPYQEVLD
ncbi:MAG: hypothetical protein ACNA7V_09565 [Bacteroidales bacterium]